MITLRTTALLMAFVPVLAGAERPELWREPADIQSRDLFYGSGGKEYQPVGPFTFVDEDLDGTNPKFNVRDAQGTKWKVKLGVEARPETVASRFVWATGYFTNEDYFLPEITVADLPSKLKRGDKLRLEGGRFENVRLKRSKSAKKEGSWKWKENPFEGTRELNGLRTMMAFLNNWDLKDENNAVVQDKEGNDVYLVSDLGASFGTDHLLKSHEKAKGNVESYEESKFITRKNAETVDFGTPGKPSAAFALSPKDGVGRFGLEWIGRNIPIGDARWIGGILGQLTPAQIRDAFRAGGYVGEEAETYAKLVEARITELKGL